MLSYRDVLAAYAHHPEPKSATLDGQPCRRQSVGVLFRRPVRAGAARLVGKESNRLDEVRYGLAHDEADVLTEYHPPARRLVCPGCGRPFDAAAPRARYCSARCRLRGFRERHDRPASAAAPPA